MTNETLSADRCVAELRQYIDAMIAILRDHEFAPGDVVELGQEFAGAHLETSQAISRAWGVVDGHVDGAVAFLMDARFAVDAMAALVTRFVADPADPEAMLKAATGIYSSACMSAHRVQHLCRAQAVPAAPGGTDGVH